jgi:hypothetical protein
MNRYFYNATGAWNPTESFEQARREADERGTEVQQHDRRTGGLWTVYRAKRVA